MSPFFVVLGISLLKTLFIPFYRSTDFEVHRNWLAITYSLPISQWYTEATSPWTLDYPPFFAWWEWLLAQVAVLIDPEMVKVTNLDYASPATIAFQRISVIAGDLVLALGTKTCHDALANRLKLNVSLNAMLVMTLANAGLLMVDHVHFQYNGFLFGFLLHSMGCVMQAKFIQGAFWFAVLLNLKHIYLYCAPVYFIYLLRHYCLAPGTSVLQALTRLISLGLVVVSVCGASFGPFLYFKQLPEVITRLFPFKRGLCHAYWAPNAWALYNGVDKVLSVVGPRIGLKPTSHPSASMTGGLVQEFDHTILPSITPLVTFLLAFLAMVPSMCLLWRRKSGPVDFVLGIILCSFASFMFGWHVHEKAILLVTIPFTILVFVEERPAQIFILLSTTAHVSLLPLLFRHQEAVLKLVVTLTYFAATLVLFGSLYKIASPWKRLSVLERLFLFGLVIPPGLELLFPLLPISTKLPFLSLMTYSLYCGLVLLFSLGQIWVHAVTRSDAKIKRR